MDNAERVLQEVRAKLEQAERERDEWKRIAADQTAQEVRLKARLHDAESNEMATSARAINAEARYQAMLARSCSCICHEDGVQAEAALAAEREAHEKDLVLLRECIKTRGELGEKWIAERERSERLRNALRIFGRHTSRCGVMLAGSDCDPAPICGLAAALRESEGGTKP
jgi:hypothetical protein